jgi:formamidopyrimidine-DNA glycosylase
MPELPDVEGYRRYLARHAQGRTIDHVDVLDTELVRNRSARSFRAALSGTRFGAPTRHGKWLIAPVGEVQVLLHFGMTGELRWSGDGSDRQRHDRVVFVCGDGELRYNNMRRFGGVWLARDDAERGRVTGPLGPDAASLSEPEFARLLDARRGGIKAALMDQRLLAGVGNLLSDEILWRACVHPGTAVRALDADARGRLYGALRAAVGESIRYGRVPHGRRWLTRVRDDRGARCPRCGTPLERDTIAGRTACWCPAEQRPVTKRATASVRNGVGVRA